MIINNLIPFAHLDGYWILSNIVEINNLSEKSKNTFDSFILKKIFSKNITVSPSLNRKRWIIYGFIDYIIGPASILIVLCISAIYFQNVITLAFLFLFIVTQLIKIYQYYLRIKNIILKESEKENE